MSMSLSSATINDLANASVNDLSGSTLDAGSGNNNNNNETPSGSSCVWTSANVTAILNALSALQSDVAAIKAKTNNLPANPAAVGSAMTLTSAYDAAKTAAPTVSQIWGNSTRTLTASPTNISGLATASALSTLQTTVNNVKAKTDNLPTSPAAVGSAMTLTSAYDAAKTAASASDVWGHSSRTLTSSTGGGATAAEVWSYSARTLTSSTGGGATAAEVWSYSSRSLTDAVDLTSTYDAAKTAAQAGDAMTLTSAYDAAKTAAKAGDAMTLTSAYDSAKTAAQAGDAMTLTSAYDSAKTAAQAGDAMTLTSAYDAAKTSTDVSGLATASAVSSLQGSVDSLPSSVWGYSSGRTLTSASLSSGALATHSDVQSIVLANGSDNTNVDANTVTTAISLLSNQVTTVGNNVTAIKAKTDNLPAQPAAVGSAMTLSSLSVNGSTIATAAGIEAAVSEIGTSITTAKNAIITEGSQSWTTPVGYATSSALSSLAGNVQSIINVLPQGGNRIPNASDNAYAVWSANTRTLTSGNNSSNASDIATIVQTVTAINGRFPSDSSMVLTTSNAESVVWQSGFRSLTSETLSGTTKSLALKDDIGEITITSEDIQLSVPDANTIANAVWGRAVNGTARTLTSASIGSGVNLLTNTDFDSVINNIESDVKKIKGMVGHWRIQGSNFIVYDDENNVLATIELTENARGEVVQMTPQS